MLEIVKDASPFETGITLDLRLAVMGLADGSGRLFTKARMEEGVVKVLVFVVGRKQDISKVLMELMREALRRGLTPDRAFVFTKDASYEIKNVGTLAKVMKGIPKLKAMQKKLGRLQMRVDSPVCITCPFNPPNLSKRLEDMRWYLRFFLRLAEKYREGVLKHELELGEAPLECVKCVMNTLKVIEPYVKSAPPPIRVVRVGEGLTGISRIEEVKNYDLLESYVVGPWEVKLVEPYQVIGGKRVYSTPMLVLSGFSQRELHLMAALRSRLAKIFRDEPSLHRLYLTDREAFKSRLMEILRGEAVGIGGYNRNEVERVVSALADLLSVAGWATPFIGLWDVLGITDIDMKGDDYITVRTIERYGKRKPTNSLKTNVFLSSQDVLENTYRLAEVDASMHAHKGFLETTVTVRVAGKPIKVRVALSRTGSNVVSNLRLMIETGFFHFVHMFKNLSADALATLSFLFSGLSALVIGEVGAVKSTLAHILINSLPPGVAVNYIAESFEMDTNVKDLVIKPFRIETSLKESMSKATAEEIRRAALRHRAEVNFYEEARTVEEMEQLIEAATISQVVTTVHADSPEDLVRRFAGKGTITVDKLARFDMILNMQRWRVGDQYRHILAGAYKLTVSRGKPKFIPFIKAVRNKDGSVSWEVLPPEKILELYKERLINRLGKSPEEMKAMIEGVKLYLNLLKEYEEQILQLSPLGLKVRQIDRYAILAIWSNPLDPDLEKILRSIIEHHLDMIEKGLEDG